MASFEGAYESLLQGVSQQIPRMRGPGQLTAQDNMVSDPVTNPRRRPGAQFIFQFPLVGATTDSLRAWGTDISGFKIQVILCVNTGTVKVLSDSNTVLATLQNDYLIAPNTRSIKAATVGNELFLANVNEQPILGAPAPGVIPPSRRGFMYIIAGTFSKTYDCRVETNAGVITGTYTTPVSTATGAATAALPENIAESLLTNLNSQNISSVLDVTVTRDGPYLYFEGGGTTTKLVVSSNAGSSFVTPSNASKVRQEGNLPARLPAAADGYIVAVGQQKILTYYKYDHPTVSWLEAGAYESPASITNMPISLRYDLGTTDWVLDSTAFEGRVAGDAETNPAPNFEQNGITGMGSYQGRLVILVGPQVILSSSRQPRRLMRSTVTGLLDEDPIAVGASANSSANYEYAVPFQKDLLLFSSKYQALIPGSGQAITPRTATVLVTSTFSGDMNSDPIPIGRTLMFATPLSSDFFGVLEMVSSQYTDGQYVSNQATAHLPKYMAGNCRFSASSTVASMVAFGQSGDKRGTIVYQYLWSGEDRVQQAWHRWTFSYDVATSYFTGEAVNFLFVKNGHVVGTRVDPKIGVLSFSEARRPYLDIYSEVTVVNNEFTLPAWLLLFDPQVGQHIKLAHATGPLAGEMVGIESVNSETGVVRTVRSYPAGTLYVGIPYRSLLSPTNPQMQDRNGHKIDSNKLTVLRFGVNTQNSSEYQVVAGDLAGIEDPTTQGTLRWSSVELELGNGRYSEYSRAVVPTRTEADSTVLQIYTDGLGELNIIGIDYTCRYNQKIRRR